MSEQAAAYYQERAVRLGIGPVPDILDGQPVPLMDEGQRLSLQMPDPARVAEVTDRYAEVLHEAGVFVAAAFQALFPECKIGKGRYGQQWETQHLTNFVTNLLPKHLKAGRVTDMQVEAIASYEVPPPELLKRGESRFFRSSVEDNEVYLLASGALFAGRPLGHVACVTVIGVGQDSEGLVAPKYIQWRFKTNEALARSGLAQSRAVRTAVDRQHSRNAANRENSNTIDGRRRPML
jgi:hypothetical protein